MRNSENRRKLDDGTVLVAKESDVCKGCYWGSPHRCKKTSSLFPCSADIRQDNRGVIWVVKPKAKPGPSATDVLKKVADKFVTDDSGIWLCCRRALLTKAEFKVVKKIMEGKYVDKG